MRRTTIHVVELIILGICFLSLGMMKAAACDCDKPRLGETALEEADQIRATRRLSRSRAPPESIETEPSPCPRCDYQSAIRLNDGSMDHSLFLPRVHPSASTNRDR